MNGGASLSVVLCKDVMMSFLFCLLFFSYVFFLKKKSIGINGSDVFFSIGAAIKFCTNVSVRLVYLHSIICSGALSFIFLKF
jgi:hypothetical protein